MVGLKIKAFLTWPVVKGKWWAFWSVITPNLRRNTTQASVDKRLRQPQRCCGRVNEGNNHSLEGEYSSCRPAHSHCGKWVIYLMTDNDGVSHWIVDWVVTNGLASMCTESVAAQPELTYSAVIRLEELRKSRKNSGRTLVSQLSLKPGTFWIKCGSAKQSVSIRLIKM
jgi:hypothetical protein